MQITFKYPISEKIHLIDLKTNGRIIGYYIGENSKLQYNVRFFVKDGDYKTCYFYEEEIQDYNKEQDVSIGFKA